MSGNDNKAIVRRLVEDVWNEGNLAVADEVCAPAYVSHDPSHPVVPPGPGGLKHLVTLFRTGFPDLQFTIEDMRVAEGEMVVTRWTARGTHRGALLAIAPTEREAMVEGITLSRMAEGKVAEEWVVWDTLALMLQLGLAPHPGQD